MTTTRVVHLKRRGGVVVQDCDVYIGRRCQQGGWDLPHSPWANPFKLARHATPGERQLCLLRYETHVRARLPELVLTGAVSRGCPGDSLI